MGLFSSIGGFVSKAASAVGSFLGGVCIKWWRVASDRRYGGSYSTSTSTSSTVTNYNPDKVEVAKLENERVDFSQKCSA